MYTQFGADNQRLNDALKILNSDASSNRNFHQALYSAFEILGGSTPSDSKKIEWTTELALAYREVGRGLIKYLDMQGISRADVVSLEKEFPEIFPEYGAGNLVEMMRTMLKDLTSLQTDALPDYTDPILTRRVASMVEDYNSIMGVMNVHDLKDGGDLEAALKERDKLLEQVEKLQDSF
ncbi:MAG TPA: hypothetical protein VMC07_00635 [Candidatus Omnitrophota bacterium]|nr:hypothetical protein [Candidatus Omnitrophota bacterium]